MTKGFKTSQKSSDDASQVMYYAYLIITFYRCSFMASVSSAMVHSTATLSCLLAFQPLGVPSF